MVPIPIHTIAQFQVGIHTVTTLKPTEITNYIDGLVQVSGKYQGQKFLLFLKKKNQNQNRNSH